ncbi:MAG: four helix bundle protein [Terricaulis sp.]
MSEGRSAPSVWDLLVFQKAYTAALEAHRIAQAFPKHEQYELASQLRRSSKSICANLAEGRARQQGSTADFRRFVLIALGSADESALWCRFAKDLGYLDEDQYEQLSA